MRDGTPSHCVVVAAPPHGGGGRDGGCVAGRVWVRPVLRALCAAKFPPFVPTPVGRSLQNVVALFALRPRSLWNAFLSELGVRLHLGLQAAAAVASLVGAAGAAVVAAAADQARHRRPPSPSVGDCGAPCAKPPNDTLGGFSSLRGAKETDESVLSTRRVLIAAAKQGHRP